MNFSFLGILPLIMGVVWVGVYWKMAEIDGQPRALWAGLSLTTFLLAWWLLGWGWLGVMMSQLLLGLVIATVRALLSMRAASGKP